MTTPMDKLNEILLSESRRLSLQSRIQKKTQVNEKTGCLEWTAKPTWNGGYGKINAGRGNIFRVHRVMWTLKNGPIPDDKCVLHRCDNPKCCNPDHLFLGDRMDNTKDMIGKGRGSKPPHSFGEAHHNTKFDTNTFLKIKYDPRPARILAEENGVSQQTIYRIRNGLTWKKISSPVVA